jgi:hypothetical protein
MSIETDEEVSAARPAGSRIAFCDPLMPAEAIRELFERTARDFSLAPEEALKEAMRLWIDGRRQVAWLEEYAKGGSAAALDRILDWRNDPRPPLPGDELPEGYVRR